MRQLSGGMKDYSFFAASFVLSKYNGHKSERLDIKLLLFYGTYSGAKIRTFWPIPKDMKSH